MKKIVFIVDSGFWDHSFKIIEELHKQIDLFVIVTDVKSPNHTIDSIDNFCIERGIKKRIVANSKFRVRNPWRIIFEYREYISTIKKINPDIIYIEHLISPYFSILSRFFLGKKKVIIAFHDVAPHMVNKRNRNKKTKIYLKLYSVLFSNFHFFSYSQRALFIKRHPNKNTFVARLFLIGPDVINNNKIRKDNKINFLYFGEIDFYKGVDVLIKAGNILGKQYDNFKITIAGNSKKFKEYSNLIKNSKIFDLKTYFIPRKDIPNEYYSADYLILPYKDVTQSGPLIMGYKYDLIPIASDLPGFKEYIEDGITGYLFKNEDSKCLADVMEKALNVTKGEKNRIKNNIDKFKEKEFNINNSTQQYLKFFNKIS